MLKTKALSATAAEPFGAWDLAYAYYDPPTPWNISSVVYSGKFFSVVTQEGTPTGIFFKPDGTKMYIVGLSGDEVNEYSLSTAWNLYTASYVQLFSVAAQDTTPSDIFFKPDGTKMYIVGDAGDDVNEYSLSTAWNISTASYVQNFSVSAQETGAKGISFKPDGTKMYVFGNTGDDINEYNLSAAWDISTASYLQNFSIAAQDLGALGFFFKPDGTKMYVSGNSIYEYSLSTAWDISTASYIQSFSTNAQEPGPAGLFFKPDGTTFYVVGGTNATVYQYTIGGFSVVAEDNTPTDVFFKPDGTRMYITGNSGDEVNEYSLSTAWNISTASYVRNFIVSGQEAAPTGIFFKPDGTRMYIVGSSGDEVNQYSLSTAWDVSTASFVQLFSVAAQDTNPSGIFFKPDGTKMYIVGTSVDSVHEYSLSTAWSVASANHSQSFSMAAEDGAPNSIYFHPDGNKMYFVGNSGDDVNEYDLSTPWDVSTAAYLQNFSIAMQDDAPQGLFFKDDGTQMFLIGTVAKSVYAYTLGVQP